MPGAALAFGPEPGIAWFAEATARVWRGEPGNPRRGRSRSGFVQGLAPLFPGRSASRPPPGIFLPSVVGSPAAYMMPSVMGPPRQARIPAHERPQSPNLAILFRRRRQEGTALMPGAALAFGPEPGIAWFAEATARVWRGEPGNPRRGRSRSGFVQGLAPLFPGRSASRPPPGIFLPSVVGSPAAYMMPGPIRSPSVHLIRVLDSDSALRQRGNTRHHRGPRPGKGTSVDGLPQQAEPAPSLFVTGRGSGAAMLMPDRVPSPARG